ncbi:hypothetical protein HDU98_008111 [Podochytrium sp. JEL0797]|nr:hypothetical protein HDU98_008111 [Podochytrium sp. JEL0797]
MSNNRQSMLSGFFRKNSTANAPPAPPPVTTEALRSSVSAATHKNHPIKATRAESIKSQQSGLGQGGAFSKRLSLFKRALFSNNSPSPQPPAHVPETNSKNVLQKQSLDISDDSTIHHTNSFDNPTRTKHSQTHLVPISPTLSAATTTVNDDLYILTPMDWDDSASVVLSVARGESEKPAGVSTPLHEACIRGDLAAVQALLGDTTITTDATHALLDACDDHDRTPLHHAVLHSTAITKVLLEKGCDAKAVDDSGWNALHFVGQTGDIEVARLLVGYGASVHVGDEDGWTPIHVAARNGYMGLVEVLVASS